ncbi:MAG: right-handed parallel beta-helix repeat-containing protein [Nitrospirae bacterium]|nr:right-handed parallel beta-helix repeat-containing protein [Nitrospirota bacterium]
MKKVYGFVLLIALIIIIPVIASADTLVSGTISSDTTWTLANSPYVVTGNITINSGVTLTIESGVTVKLQNGRQLLSQGTLTATNVTFTWADGVNRWGGIKFEGTGSTGSRLENCSIDYANGYSGYYALWTSNSSPTITGNTINNSTADYGVYVDITSSPSITNNTITGMSNSGIYVTGASPTVTGNTISNNNYGIYITSTGSGTYQNNTITGNITYGFYNSGSTMLNATNNNWGHSSGPYDPSDDRATGGLYNPTGLGNKVSDKVNYYPWTGITICITAVPTGLSSTPGSYAVNLKWNANTEPCIGGYKIYYGTSSGNYTTPKVVGNVTSYKLTSLTNGIKYYIAISSMNTVGVESVKSAEITQTPIYDVTKPLSQISRPSTGAVLIGMTHTVEGIASDAGTGVQKVEVTRDNGVSWSTCSGTTAWTCTISFPSDGTYTIKSRATDNADNVETVGAGITVTVAIRNPNTVTISNSGGNRTLLINSNPFNIRGVGYSPVPIGVDPETTPPYGDYFTSTYNSIHDRDLPLLREMGANTLRLWAWNNTENHLDFMDKAYNNGTNPIYIIASYWINTGRDIDPASPSNERQQIKEEFMEMVTAHKNHPAILMWSIGNELNADWMYGSQLNNLFSLINDMAAEAHAEDPNHPVTTPLADVDIINTITTYDASMTSLDVWGANIYRGNTFGTLFTDYETASTKPLVILEYGIDAYDDVNNNEYENIGTPHQADYASALWNEIEINSDICIGGAIMEYSDEWWKGKYSSDSGCPDNDPSVHSTCGYATTSHPDGYSNEEWWGIMRTKNNGSNPDIMEQRQAYNALKTLWTGTGVSITITTSPSGLHIIVDGINYTAPQTFNWTQGSSHTIGVSSPQDGSTGTRYVYSSWSDDGAQTHTITTPSSTKTYTAYFKTQYKLTTSVNPGGGGSVSPDCSGGCWYDAGTIVTLTATPNTGYSFSSWSDGGAQSHNVTMDAPKTITANFSVNTNSDLIITSVTGPTTAVPGTLITIGDTTKNQGVGTAPASKTKFYWSTNNTYSADDQLLGERSVLALAPSATNTGTIQVTVPNTCSTTQVTFYIIAKADALGAVAETNENNNTKAKSIKMGPDLIISAITTSPLTSGAGKTVNVTDTTKNQGGCSAGASTTKFYLSNNSTWDAGDTYLAERLVPVLPPSGIDTKTTPVTIPADTATSTTPYYIIARADANLVVTETSETNNNKGKSIKIGPNLIVSSITAPTSAARGATISVGDTTKNSGGGDAGASTTKLYLSTNATYDAGDILLCSDSVPSLLPNTTDPGTCVATIPSGISAGAYYIIAIADADNAVPETNEADNTKYKPITIN